MIIRSEKPLGHVPHDVTFTELIFRRVPLWPHRTAVVSIICMFAPFIVLVYVVGRMIFVDNKCLDLVNYLHSNLSIRHILTRRKMTHLDKVSFNTGDH